jgi:predicted Fe-Mo cluster-binding NifX family protein
MKVAIPCTDQDETFQHFGHAEQFAIYEYTEGEYVDRKVFATKCRGHEEIAKLMRYLGINIVVCGGIGDGAIAALMKHKILIYAGAEGNIDQAYYALVNNRLNCTSKPTCSSHNCSCGSHGGCDCGCCG